MPLRLVGISHREAPVAVRERLFLAPDRVAAFIADFRPPEGEMSVLSTCNRTEVYLVADDDVRAARAVCDGLSALSGLEHREIARVLQERDGEEASLHLCRVAAGLDSLVPGESQILGQVRDAYEHARAASALGPVLNRLFRQALSAGKRVRAETAIGERPASVPAAAVELAERVFGPLAGKRALVVGAGKIGELAATALRARGVDVVVANRSLGVAAQLATRLEGEAVPLDDVELEVGRADIVVASTRASGHILTASQVAAALEHRAARPVFFIDLAVPRNLDPAIHDLPCCFVYDIDDLEAVVSTTVAGRAQEAAQAERIAATQAFAFLRWQRERDVVPAIRLLRKRAEQIREAELARVEGRLAGLTARERRTVDSVTAQIMNKLLHAPTVRVKEASAGAEGGSYAEALRHLFDLDSE